jgi:ADP-ribose pyrophosphatase
VKLGKKKVFNGRLIKVFKSIKKLPNAGRGYFEEVEHPGAALIIPFIGKKIVFIRQYRGVIGKYIWELPAGTLAFGETPYACAKREVIEETGYSVKNLKRIGMIYTTPGFCNEKIIIFKAECDKKRETQQDPDEIISAKSLSKEQVRRLFKQGRIIDSKTIAALSFASIL